MDQGLESGSKEFYVAPIEAPASRRPPITEVGLIHWLRTNLFGGIGDTILSLITLAVVLVILREFFSWAIFKAQWEIVFLNLRTINVGQQFPIQETWRIEVVGLVVVFMSMLSVGVWGRVTRGVVLAVIAIALATIIVPFMSKPVSEPPIFTYVDENYAIRQLNFTADKDQEITFTIDPLTELPEYEVSNVKGYIENDNQQSNTAFDAFNTASTAINAGNRDPQEYDLNVAVQIWKSDGQFVATSPFTEGSTDELEFTWTATADGWYTYTLVRDEENPGTIGSAWLKAEGIEVFRSTLSGQEERVAKYGPEPILSCQGCATSTNRTDMRFEGTRTLAQWFSLQLTPFLLEIRGFFFVSAIVGAIGYLLGMTFGRVGLQYAELLKSTERFLLILATVWFSAYIGAIITGAIDPQNAVATLKTAFLVILIITMIGYALVQFLKDDPRAASRGVTILWILSIPIILMLITGFSSVGTIPGSNPPFPKVETRVLGGLLLTLILSAIAIIASFPIGMIFALGRQSKLPVVSMLSTIFIEVFRGVPLITLLFMGSLILPFFGFGLGNVDLLIRISVVMTLFTSAYMAEVIRGGLQIIPNGQLEASYALGFNGFWTTTLIVLPQALRAVIPAIMGQAVSLFKDTSLVYIVSLYEILGSMYQILGDSQTGYIAFPREGYLYVGIVYFIISYMMADVSRRIERTGAGSIRRETI
jgi:general L-amino acid transport system permease protein